MGDHALQVTTTEITAWIGGFLWTLLRVSVMLAATPIFSARMVPLKVRLTVGLLLTWMVLPFVPPVPAVEPLGPIGLLISMHQLLIGLAMGFTFQMVFAALAVAGESVAMSMGLGFAFMIDPQNGIQVPVLSSFYVVLGTLLFVALNGHLALIEMLVDSFNTLPIGVEGLGPERIWQLVTWAGRMFRGAVLVALPVLTSMLLVNLTLGVITRAAPQLNVFAVGFPMTLFLGFVLLLLSIPSFVRQFEQLLAAGYTLIAQITG
jgi:flagellar biosynthetic protein FliR